MTTHLTNRIDFVYLFDVRHGNPNGDPDGANMPRTDVRSGRGLVTDVCIKRKVRDYVDLIERPGLGIFMQRQVPLNPRIAEACEATGQPTHGAGGKWDRNKAKSRSVQDVRELQRWLCEKYYDIRTFGAVLSSGPNAGQLRGPAQLTFAESIDPVDIETPTLTRVADVDDEHGQMGQKPMVVYGLYRMHGFISAKLAEQTGFSPADSELLFEALTNAFEHDRSANRGEMTARALVCFKHDHAMGDAPAHKLFERVTVQRAFGERGSPASAFTDYVIDVDIEDMPTGVTCREVIR